MISFQQENVIAPDKWKYVSLNEVLDQRSEIFQPSPKIREKFVGLEHIESGESKLKKFETNLDLKSTKSRFYLGDILYGKLRPYLDKAAISDIEGICSTDLLVLTPKKEKSIAEFLINVFHSHNFIKYSISTTSGTNHPRTSWNAISEYVFYLPPLPEQRRIAAILTTVDDAIQRSRQAAAETERLKAGVMQKLMTKGIGHTEFREDPEIGTVPNEWKTLKLEDICISNAFGPRFSNSFYDDLGNVAVLRTTDLDPDGNISYEQMPRANLDLNAFKDHFLHPNDLVISRSGTCGIGAIFSGYKIPVLPGAFLIRFRLSPEIDPQFLKQYINSSFGKKQITKLECGGVQKNLKGSALLKIKIPHPSPSEQQHIISVISCIDHKLSFQRKRIANYKRLKQGLMNELLTGKWRVKNDTGDMK